MLDILRSLVIWFYSVIHWKIEGENKADSRIKVRADSWERQNNYVEQIKYEMCNIGDPILIYFGRHCYFVAYYIIEITNDDSDNNENAILYTISFA